MSHHLRLSPRTLSLVIVVFVFNGLAKVALSQTTPVAAQTAPVVAQTTPAAAPAAVAPALHDTTATEAAPAQVAEGTLSTERATVTAPADFSVIESPLPATPETTAAAPVTTAEVSSKTSSPGQSNAPAVGTCKNTIQADVVALDQPFMLNRLGAAMPQGMIFALDRDVVPIVSSKGKAPGNVMLRSDKRPRPIVLRVNQGDCLVINFTNLLSPAAQTLQPATRSASLHLNGIELATANKDDGSFVGTNQSSLADVGSGGKKTYQLYAAQTGTYLLYSTGATFGNVAPGDAGQISAGMFGAVNVEPPNAEYYRSQATAADYQLACKRQDPYNPNSPCLKAPDGHLIVDYNAVYPSSHKYGCRPILKMVDIPQRPSPGVGRCLPIPNALPQTFYTDLTAIITGPNAGPFTPPPGPVPPEFAPVSSSPDRTQPWREFTIIYHEVPTAVQAFKEFYPLPVAQTPLSQNMTDSGTTPITVGSTNGFPASGFLGIDTNGDAEFVQYTGKSATQLGTTSLTRGVNGTPIAHTSGVPITQYRAEDISSTLTAGQDNFAVNYGTGGIGAEILANRFQVGPMANCVECKFEEFFLSAWSVGDPAMVVDVPANAPTYSLDKPNSTSAFTNSLEQLAVSQTPLPPTPANPSTKPPSPANPTNNPNICAVQGKNQPCLKATKAFYPDDPSNVYHSYLDDHVKFQILNAGGSISHVHHQHAHQWLHTPNDTDSSYLDSQFISPGAAFTLEINYDGSGNRNKTAGDSIFHCHFYPHFAAGMWGMWRVHDVFEAGSQLQADGLTPVTGINRVLPDGEIANGSPIPAIVPIPTLAQAPTPARVQICPAFNNWQVGNTVGTACPPPPGLSSPIGFAAMVNTADFNSGLNPGFPFFVPGIAGHRAPHPPFDFAYENKGSTKVYYDGGLPRHLIRTGTFSLERHNQWDFTKDNDTLNAIQLPEDGTAVEQVAMKFMSQRKHQSFTPDGQTGLFLVNGLPRKPGASCPGEPDGKCKQENQYGSQLGAPFADPAVIDDPKDPTNVLPVGSVRRYKAAVIQKDVVFSKQGWHFPQQRFETLWNDVASTMANTKVPEPLFFRANSRQDVLEFWHTNLVPDYYELDDFQVRTPTDILGQHIHLVKFDVLASDGAGNGFNYEDGTLSPDDVVHRLNAMNAVGGLFSPDGKTQTIRKPIPVTVYPFGTAPYGQDWTGTQTTVQRWYADPLIGCPNGYEGCEGQANADRTLRTVFTHDHFGPSTHQQAGLYSGLLIEPEGSSWINPETKEKMGTRADGGPTGWQANIVTVNQSDSYREFALEFQDLTLAYDSTSKPNPDKYPANPPLLIQPNTPYWGWASCIKQPDGSYDDHSVGGGGCSPGNPILADPSLISANQGVGTASVNYRTEPLRSRVTASTNTDPNNMWQASDLSYAFSSIERLNNAFNQQPDLGTPINQKNQFDPRNTFVFPGGFAGATGYDPYTPLLRAYQRDRVQVRVLVGAHLFQHSFTMHGLKWLFEPSSSTSGWRDNHTMGISEHFEMLFTVPSSLPAKMDSYFQAPPPKNQVPKANQPVFADYLYMPGASTKDLRNGLWGMLRAYNTGGDKNKVLPDLLPLPNNNPANSGQVPPVSTADMTCPVGAPRRTYFVAAITSISGSGKNATPVTLVYNNRNSSSPITNSNSMVYVMADQNGNPQLPKDKNGNPLPPTAPIVLRASAGECIQVKLFNQFNTLVPDIIDPTGGFGNPSANAGLHPQLVSADVTQSNGINIGFNQEQTACPPGSTQCPTSKTYTWYSGNINTNSDGSIVRRPTEFGAVNLLASDPINQQSFSMIGALVIEPTGATWCSSTSPSTCSGPAPGVVIPETTVDVSYAETDAPSTVAVSKKYREFVAIMQNNLNGPMSSVNYGAEPMNSRFTTTDWSSMDLSGTFSNALVAGGTSPSGQCTGDPYTPVFTAYAGTPVRFRMLHPDGSGGFPDSVWTLHGHPWQELPFLDACLDPTKPCPNPRFVASARQGANYYSQWMGSRDGFGPNNHFDMLINRAGGNFGVPADYLYRTYPASDFINGTWGVFRVIPVGPYKCPSVKPLARVPAPVRGIKPFAVLTGPAVPAQRHIAGSPEGQNPPNPANNGFERFFQRSRAEQRAAEKQKTP